MIDISTERLIALREVPRHLPARSAGRRLHIATVYRWVQRGVRGVRLESITIGGTRYTSVEALQQFADWLSQPRDGLLTQPPAKSNVRQKQLERVSRFVESILGGKRARESKQAESVSNATSQEVPKEPDVLGPDR